MAPFDFCLDLRRHPELARDLAYSGNALNKSNCAAREILRD